MSALAVPARAPIATARAQEHDCPALPAILRRLGVSLAVACGIPALLFYAGLQLSGLVVAVLAALLWSYGAAIWRRATGRPTSGLLMLAVVILTVRTVFVLTTGNAFVYFLQPIATDGIVALLFLASLASTRPLVARLAVDFYPLSAEQAAHPQVRRLFRHLTLMWGCVGLVKAGGGYWLLETLSMAHFVLVKDGATIALTVLAVVVTVKVSLGVLGRVAASR